MDAKVNVLHRLATVATKTSSSELAQLTKWRYPDKGPDKSCDALGNAVRVPRDFYAGSTLEVAQRLLGTVLVRSSEGQRTSGIIVEVEAYLHAADPASHSFRGPSRRNAAMFMAPGTLYVYSIHARYCLNIVTEPESMGAAVLVRALQPLEGIELMQQRRGAESMRDLCSGPARLCQALAIDIGYDRTDLITSEEIWLEMPPTMVREKRWQITESPRIGISTAQDMPYRYFIDGHYCVSGLARLHRSRRQWLFG